MLGLTINKIDVCTCNWPVINTKDRHALPERQGMCEYAKTCRQVYIGLKPNNHIRQVYRLCSIYTGHVLASYDVPPTSRCVNSDWTSPPTSKNCVMNIEWTEVSVGNLQHKSKYVTLTFYPRISFYSKTLKGMLKRNKYYTYV